MDAHTVWLLLALATSLGTKADPAIGPRDESDGHAAERHDHPDHGGPLLMDPLLGAGFMTTPDNTLPDLNTTLEHMRCRINRTNMLNLQLARGYDATKRLAVITARDKEYGGRDYYRAVLQVRHATSLTRKYCRVWGCDFYEEMIVRNARNRCDDLNLPEHKDLADVLTDFQWCKILKLRSLALTAKYDYILWLDADAAIVDQSYDVRLLMDMHPRAFVIASEEHGRGYDENVLNGGVMMFRVTPELPSFFAEWWNTLETNKNLSWLNYDWDFEQGVLNLALLPKYGQEKIAVLKPCWLFEWPEHMLEQGWIIHLPVADPPRKTQEKGRYLRFWDEVYYGGTQYNERVDTGKAGSTAGQGHGTTGQYSVTASAIQSLAGGGVAPISSNRPRSKAQGRGRALQQDGRPGDGAEASGHSGFQSQGVQQTPERHSHRAAHTGRAGHREQGGDVG